MGTDQIIHNTKYYDGFEDMRAVILAAPNNNLPVVHICEGYFYSIFKHAPRDGKGWYGFTRDYKQFEGVFDEGEDQIITDLQEYINDLLYYKDVAFDYEDTRGAYELLLNWFITAKELGCKEVLVRLD